MRIGDLVLKLPFFVRLVGGVASVLAAVVTLRVLFDPMDWSRQILLACLVYFFCSTAFAFFFKPEYLPHFLIKRTLVVTQEDKSIAGVLKSYGLFIGLSLEIAAVLCFVILLWLFGLSVMPMAFAVSILVMAAGFGVHCYWWWTRYMRRK